MGCLCFPTLHEPIFHFPNFTFAHSQHSLQPRHIHSTFSLRRARQRRKPRRRHTFHLLRTNQPLAMAPQHQDEYAPPPGPPPDHQAGRQTATNSSQTWSRTGLRSSELAPNNPFRNAHPNTQGFQPYRDDSSSVYEAPPGPPPGRSEDGGEKSGHESDRPDPENQGFNDTEPPPYDPWLAVPDTSLLPPPPSLHEEFSPTANASYDDAERGHTWCRHNPLWQPRDLNTQTLYQISIGDIRLTTPPNAQNVLLDQSAMGKMRLRSTEQCTDSIFLSNVPLYAAFNQARPLQQPVTLYYEIQVLAMGTGEGDSGIAIGFVAPPYPSWRLPGWHRASFGIHGDDGRRYVDDSYGGFDFTSPFRRGEVVGVGMTISPPMYQNSKNRCQIFFTRNGKHDGGWDLHEERDSNAEEGDVTGLEGDHDLLAAIGCFGATELEVRFKREDWLWKG